MALSAADSDSSSSSGSDSSSSSSSSEEERRRREKKKEKKRKREKESKKESKKRKKGKKEKKEKKHKKDKKHKKKSKKESGAGTSQVAQSQMQWGKYGIIKDEDMYSKQEEFYSWLSEVKGVPMDQCGNREIKEYFSSFCEDFNTATMPDDKYYNLAAWWAKEQQRIAIEGVTKSSATFERTDFNDEDDRKSSIKQQADRKNSDVAKVMMQNMSGDSNLVMDMRQQAEDAQAMRLKMHTGDTDAAREMIKRLDPNHVTEEQLRAVWGSGAGAAKKQRKPQKS